MRKRLNVGSTQRLGTRYGNRVFRGGNIAAHMLKLHKRHTQISRIDSLNRNRATEQGTRRKERACFDAVAHRSVLAWMHFGESNTLYRNGWRARALHMSAHGIQHIG